VSRWGDPALWARLVAGEECGICRDAPPAGAVATLEASWVVPGEDGPMRGYCWLPLRRHAVELHDLGPAEAGAYVRDMQRVGRAVQALTGAVKLNWELHGNTVPHLHAHLFPRYPGDPFEHGPIDPRAVRAPVYGPGEFERFREDLRAALAGPAADPARRIAGFHTDDEGHWVAELECGHGQHVRHDPPWQLRPWVTTPEGRAGMLGTTLRCRRCAAAGQEHGGGA
jgi:diadenosine tetraphosphate (Ap4A) HIT family hydrolase